MQHEMSVMVDRKKVIEIVKQNKEAHIAEVIEAKKRWQTKMMQLAQKIIEVGPKLKKFPRALHLLRSEPESHAKDFDKALKMLELDVRDTIELPPRLFGQLILNQWDWSGSHSYMNFAYGVTGATGPCGDTGSTGLAGEYEDEERPDEIAPEISKDELGE
jgi:hypothetical protein